MEEAALAGHQVTGLTLSTEQQSFAIDRVNRQCPNRHEVRLQDYRDCKDQFDGIASIEMFEAVGKKYWDIYFKILNNALKKMAKHVFKL